MMRYQIVIAWNYSIESIISTILLQPVLDCFSFKRSVSTSLLVGGRLLRLCLAIDFSIALIQDWCHSDAKEQ